MNFFSGNEGYKFDQIYGMKRVDVAAKSNPWIFTNIFSGILAFGLSQLVIPITILHAGWKFLFKQNMTRPPLPART